MPLLTTLAALGASAGAKALGSSALELGGNIGGAAYSAKQSQKMAREQMAFQERMSSTAHQREVEDLRKAGLNPILSANAGASSPGGSMGTMPDLSDLGTKVTSSARDRARVNISALQTKYNVLAMRKDMEKRDKEMALLDVQKDIANQEALVKNADAWSAQNMLRMKQKHPEFFGAVDAYGPLFRDVISTAKDFTVMGRAIKGFGGFVPKQGDSQEKPQRDALGVPYSK